MDDFFENVRLWQIQFETGFRLPSLPVPDILAEEEEKTPAYIQDGRRRQNASGGQFVITLQGRGAIRIGGKEYNLTPGKTFLHNHNDPEVCYYYPLNGKEPWRFLWLSLEGENIRQLIQELIRRSGYLYDVPLEGELVKKLLSFRCENRQVRFLSPIEGAELAISALRMLCSPRAEEPMGTSMLLATRVQEIIASEYRQPLTAIGLARRFGVSREHLSRTFRQETGMTLRDCLNRVRMRAAAELLKQTRMTIKEISFQCGFEDYPTFYRAFQHSYRISPGEFRQGNLYRASL